MVRSLIHVRDFIYTLHWASRLPTHLCSAEGKREEERKKGRTKGGKREGKREGGMTLTTHKELTFHHP